MTEIFTRYDPRIHTSKRSIPSFEILPFYDRRFLANRPKPTFQISSRIGLRFCIRQRFVLLLGRIKINELVSKVRTCNLAFKKAINSDLDVICKNLCIFENRSLVPNSETHITTQAPVSHSDRIIY
ncbi:hypothetical protein [Leptospira santarosai]|uniref:hypothetical protein n=1 Tax=Leptospira santarosai TaxID=28183 RepID=UPI0009BEF6EE